MSILLFIHVAAVVVSGSGFLLRGIGVLSGSSLMQQRWLKITPHIVDTVLLVSAIGLSIQLQQYPFVHSWVTAKVIALLAYIVLGTIALKRGKTWNQRLIAFILALLCFLYIVLVAYYHDAAFLF